MTPKQKARLDYFNYEAGIKLGSEIAQNVVDKYSNGFDDAKCAELAKEIKQSEAAASAVIPKRFRESFSAGFHVGRRSTISKYQDALSLRILGLQ